MGAEQRPEHCNPKKYAPEEFEEFWEKVQRGEPIPPMSFEEFDEWTKTFMARIRREHPEWLDNEAWESFCEIWGIADDEEQE